MDTLAAELFLKLWAQDVFALLVADGKITKKVLGNIRSWSHSGYFEKANTHVLVGQPAGT